MFTSFIAVIILVIFGINESTTAGNLQIFSRNGSHLGDIGDYYKLWSVTMFYAFLRTCTAIKLIVWRETFI